MADNKHLDSQGKHPITGHRKEYFEDLRKNHMPRYLFCAWTSDSGGGSTANIITATAIVPHGFMYRVGMPRTELADFYNIPEGLLHYNALNHYKGSTQIYSCLSSWSPSLPSVICYAMWLENITAHIAVIGTHELEDGTLVWSASHLLGQGYANFECLALGRIRGSAYQVVGIQTLEANRLQKILRETDRGMKDQSDKSIRASVSRHPPRVVDADELWLIETIGSLFKHLAFPVVSALICLRPRGWQNWRMITVAEDQPGYVQEDIIELKERMRITNIPSGLHQESWLSYGMVDTAGLPEVQQWIDMMSMITVDFSAVPPPIVPESVKDKEEQPIEKAEKKASKAAGKRKDNGKQQATTHSGTESFPSLHSWIYDRAKSQPISVARMNSVENTWFV